MSNTVHSKRKIRKRADFRPPEPNTLLIAMGKMLLPFYCRFVTHLSFQFKQSSNQPLTKLKNKRTIILLNHADRHDPIVVVALAKEINEKVFCLAAREVFDWNHGFLGWLLQKFGVYSVNRGIADVESIRTTKEILRKTDSKLIVFPEAEITGDDNTVHSINNGLVHIILDTQEDLDESKDADSVWVLPTGVHYSLQTSFETSVEPILKKIERHLMVGNQNSSNIDNRIVVATEKLLVELANRFEFALPARLPQDQQVNALAVHICQRVADITATDLSNKETAEAMLYALRNEIIVLLSEKNSDREKIEEGSEELEHVERLLIFERILNTDATSPMRVCRILDFLEIEAVGHISSKGHQKVSIYFGDPIDVKNYLDDYKASKREAIDALTANIHASLQAALNDSKAMEMAQAVSQFPTNI